ncbi:MAG: pyridoxine 5'-phosphate synthase [Candidatus Saganbacteria bacterium]|nr:pyridoxine 5'-phosphate synthase [Candidatus Saganbacteria bacterium]
MRLGVNIDHIATLRQTRLEASPDPLAAARAALAGGADGIVCHLREDRRHIQPRDVYDLKKLGARLDLEMAATPAMVRFALKVKPEMVTLVPEKRRELTTEGGLNLNSKVKSQKSKIRSAIRKLQDAGIVVSLFIDPAKEQVEEAAALTADFVELHTGAYARKASPRELEKLGLAARQARMIGLRVNAGHGLDYHNVKNVARIPGIEELNIGFSIIARAVFVGMKKATEEMKNLIPHT